MAFEDTNITRVKQLINDPANGIKKIVPFLRSRLNFGYRRILESLHIYALSRPYIGHEDLLKSVNLKNGFFVQCGGNDGYGADPTYYLEKALKWEGIIVEPLPIYKLCKRNRPHARIYNCAVGAYGNPNKTVSFVDCNLMSFVEGSIDNDKEWIEAGEKSQSMKSRIVTVPIRPVQELIDDYFKSNKLRDIDLFVADTEGYEFEVIQGLDFSKNSPSYIVLEIHTDERLAAINAYLISKRYFLVGEIGHHDYVFKLNESETKNI